MDERVRELLERVRETAVTVGEAAGTTARYAGKCAGQMVDVAKLNMRIFDLNGEINDLLKSIGRMVYDTHRGAEPDAASLAPLLSQIDEKHEAIAQLKQRIRLLKNVRSCPDCGYACGRDAGPVFQSVQGRARCQGLRHCRQIGGCLSPGHGRAALSCAL